MAFALDLPGTAGHYASAPDDPAFDLSATLLVWVDVAMDDWTPAANQTLASRWVDVGNNHAYLLRQQTSGAPLLNLSDTGANSVSTAADATVAFSDGTRHGMLAEWRTSDDRLRYFTTDDPVDGNETWAQLGTDRSLALGNIFAASAGLEVGAFNVGASQPLAGVVHGAAVLSGAEVDGAGAISGGTVVASPSFDRNPARPRDALLTGVGGTNSFLDAQGNLWALNGGNSKYVAV